jgi:hypothetical protein
LISAITINCFLWCSDNNQSQWKSAVQSKCLFFKRITLWSAQLLQRQSEWDQNQETKIKFWRRAEPS